MTDSTESTPPVKPYRLQPPADIPETIEPEFASHPPQSPPGSRPAFLAPGPGSAAGGTGAAGANGTPLAAMNPLDRYGTRQGMSRGRKIGLAVIGLAILGGVAGYIGWEQSHPAIQATVLKFVPQTNSVAVTFEVDKAADKTATCTLEALDTRHSVVGSVAVQVPAGRGTNVMSYTLSTTSQATTVEVSSCTITS
jgi:Domain of unknown function (DUF4307)